jgi:hypothetical protein
MRTPRRPHVAARRCRGRCNRILPLAAYHRDNEALDGRQAYCPQCKADSTREAAWLRNYGLRPGRAQRCLELQTNLCPLCDTALDFEVKHGLHRKWTLCVDHDHDTGEVRGLVHSICNLSPPPNGHASKRWAAYCDEPPMRAAHNGVPLIAPISGQGNAQLELLDYEPPRDVITSRRGPHPTTKTVT